MVRVTPNLQSCSEHVARAFPLLSSHSYSSFWQELTYIDVACSSELFTRLSSLGQRTCSSLLVKLSILWTCEDESIFWGSTDNGCSSSPLPPKWARLLPWCNSQRISNLFIHPNLAWRTKNAHCAKRVVDNKHVLSSFVWVFVYHPTRSLRLEDSLIWGIEIYLLTL